MIRKLKNKELNRLSADDFKLAEKFPLLLALDNVRSMLNVGSMFRTADSFKLEGLILGGISGQPPHREIHKSALGAEETVAWWHYPNLAQGLKEWKEEGYCILGLEQTTGSMDIRQYTLSRPSILVLGNEVEGVSDEVLALCEAVLEIPQWGSKHSLNVGVSAGIAAWQLLTGNKELGV